VSTGVHYYPIHLYDTCYGTQSELPVAETEMKRIMSLPIFPDMTDDHVTQVADLVKKFYATSGSAKS
jgi:perosamine synthetase